MENLVKRTLLNSRSLRKKKFYVILGQYISTQVTGVSSSGLKNDIIRKQKLKFFSHVKSTNKARLMIKWYRVQEVYICVHKTKLVLRADFEKYNKIESKDDKKQG